MTSYDLQMNSDGSVQLQNENLKNIDVDFLYHFGIDNKTTNLEKAFGDVNFVVMGGSEGRMESFAKALYNHLKDKLPDLDPQCAQNDLAKKGGRYVMFKIANTLILNHGMGFGSLSIALHEVLKLLFYAKAKNLTFIRMGTCGGVGQEAGTICITKTGYTQLIEPYFPYAACGKVIKLPSTACDETIKNFSEHVDRAGLTYAIGNTVSTDDFYEGQGRTDGAFCHYTSEEKLQWLRELSSVHNVINFEMEACLFIASCNRAKVKSLCACAAMLNRLNGDQITSPKEKLGEYVEKLMNVVIEFVSAPFEK
ncbi:Oidioi.mRNA.OKI2018_I69.chr1.g187.t1.cds [Oikopleura dioica]|uniref:Oidioi.mRNA.OKI2018_I69.chr1.g187.t1.cds n=1 Tax=Oikopleura dioica TaxID=34765 RepID=A0ABN7SQC2_OIKDI|nr:Oidioi.mRNA.OKI2018_I69.chr1.g187.t1.cds [Oikopleura dioica]